MVQFGVAIGMLILVSIVGTYFMYKYKRNNGELKEDVFEVENIKPKYLSFGGARKAKYTELGIEVEKLKVNNINAVDKNIFEVFELERENGVKNKEFIEWFERFLKGEIPFKMYVSENKMYLLFQKNILNLYNEEKSVLDRFLKMSVMKRN